MAELFLIFLFLLLLVSIYYGYIIIKEIKKETKMGYVEMLRGIAYAKKPRIRKNNKIIF